MGLSKFLLRVHIKHGTIYTILIMFFLSFAFPGIGTSAVIDTMLVFIGILFGIIVGFFIADLYSRFQSIKENAAIDASGLATYYSFCKILVAENKQTKWLERQREIIDRYVRKFMPLPWTEYSKTEPEFTELLESMKDIKYDTNKANETYSNMLAVVSTVSDAREKLVMSGNDRLTQSEWVINILLAGLLLFSLFYVKTLEPVSIIFTALLASSIIILLLVIRDLDNLHFGESIISIEPYERVLDAIEKPRYYKRKY